TLTAAQPGVAGAPSVPCNITPGSATQLVVTGQPTSATAGNTITPVVQVTAQDGLGNTVTGFTGTVTMVIGGNPGGGTLSGRTSVAAAAGVATFAYLSINKSGAGYTLSASATGVTAATSTSFNITSAA